MSNQSSSNSMSSKAPKPPTPPKPPKPPKSSAASTPSGPPVQPAASVPPVSPPAPQYAAPQYTAPPANNAYPPASPYAYPYSQPAPTQSPGNWMGAVSIILGLLWVSMIGLPLGIASVVKANRYGTSKVAGVIGIIINSVTLVISIIVTILLVSGAMQPLFSQFDHAGDNKGKEKDSARTVRSVSLDDNYQPQGSPVWRIENGKLPEGWKEFENDNGIHWYRDSNSILMTISVVGSENFISSSDRVNSRKVIEDKIGNAKSNGDLVTGIEWYQSFADFANDRGAVQLLCARVLANDSSGKPHLSVICSRAYGKGSYLLYLYNNKESLAVSESAKAMFRSLVILEKKDAKRYSGEGRV